METILAHHINSEISFKIFLSESMVDILAGIPNADDKKTITSLSSEHL